MAPEEIFLKNSPLVMFVVRNLKVRKQDIEDFAQIGYIGLWKACKRYDKKFENKFSTFAIKCIKNEIFQYSRKQKKQFNTLLFCEMDESYLNKIPAPDNYDFENSIDANIEDILKSLTEEERKLFSFKLDGLSQVKIANQLGVSQKTVSTKLKKLKEKLWKK